MTVFEQNLHWFYVVVMFASAVALFAMSRNAKGVPDYKYAIHIFVVVWSGLAYSALAMNQGWTMVAGQQVLYARYIDWVVTTPLLLLSLTLTGKYFVDVKGGITAALLGTQAIMIITGLVAELSAEPSVQYFWYIAGCVALAMVLYLFWGPLYDKAKSQEGGITEVYRKSATFLTVQWLLYPVAWIIGTPGLGWLDSTTTTILFIILPIISKAGFAFFNLGLLRKMETENAEYDQRIATR
ncbi:MAG: bacteriorhodopsin [Cytophagales bacterium]|jgi:bacteriorhodopsin|nr:bacteriorhodopsin [Cytophagales bacterium]